MHTAVPCYVSSSSMRLLFIQVLNTTKSTASFKTCNDSTDGFGFLFPSDSSFIHGRRRERTTVNLGPLPRRQSHSLISTSIPCFSLGNKIHHQINQFYPETLTNLCLCQTMLRENHQLWEITFGIKGKTESS